MDRFRIEISSCAQPPSIQWGSMLHGILMENLPAPWPEEMHQAGMRPFSQWVEVMDAERFIWHISCLDDDLGRSIGDLVAENREFEARYISSVLKVDTVAREHVTLAEYMKSFFLAEEACYGLYMSFRTPATHKTQGQYAVFPSVDLIAGNLNKRLCMVAPDFALNDEEAFEQVVQHTRIQRYRLESARFQLEGTGVIGYTGRMELRFSGPDPLKRLAGALFSFADWSGVGIKTALGMGGCVTTIKEGKKSND